MNEVWAVQLRLLCAFDGVCFRHGLTYFAGGGTLLGAVRHGGYIPWDDDVDLFMPRYDYDRLLALTAAFRPPFFLQTAYNDTGYSRGHAQLRLDGTTAILTGERGKYRFHQGIFIDIFPLDFVPDDPVEQAAQRRRLARWNRLLAATVRYPGSPHKTPLKTAIHCLLKPVPYRWIYRRMEAECKRYHRTSRVALLGFAPQSDRWVMPASAFAGSVRWSFEGTTIPIPVGFDAVLTAAYGDWRTPHHAPTCHEGIFFDPHRDWRAYIK